MNQIKVTSEKDAFDLIQRALKDEIGDDFNITFENWPKLTITLEGDGYNGTITPSMMEGLIKFQEGLNRTYAKVVYNQDSARHLKNSEKQDIEFKAKVSEGCTLIEVPLSDFAQKVLLELVGKMEPSHIVVMSIAGMALWVAGSVWKKHLEEESKIKDVQEETKKMVALSEQETERAKIMMNAVSKFADLASIEQDARSSRVALLRGVGDAASIEINGLEFKNADAVVLASTKRTESMETQLNGNYQILAVDTSHPEEIKIKVHSVDDGREFSAKFLDQTLDQSQIGILKDAEWARKKVFLSVNATELRGQITTATIVSVRKQPS